MTNGTLLDLYRGYIDCLNAQNWQDLGQYVGENVTYNGEFVGLAAYRQARQTEFRDIPDLRFTIRILIASEATVASRLDFNISPKADFLGLPVNGRHISFSENVFYEFKDNKIVAVWSAIDKSAIEAQLSSA